MKAGYVVAGIVLGGLAWSVGCGSSPSLPEDGASQTGGDDGGAGADGTTPPGTGPGRDGGDGSDASAPKPTCSAFSASPTPFALPSAGVPIFEQTGGRGFCTGGGDYYWTTLDADGDSTLDLVLTKKCADPTVGVSTWQVFRCLP